MYRYLASLLLCLPGLLFADDIRLSPAQVARAGIATQALAEFRAVGMVRLPGQVIVPPTQIEVVAAAAPAMVAAVRVAQGDTVRRGQALIRLQGGELLELQRELITARAQAQLSAENRRRDESLFADGIIAQSRLAATQAAERQAAALFAERRQTLQLAAVAEPGADGRLSGVAELRAPFDGVVLEAPAQPGQRVDSLTPLLKLGRLAPLWLEIQASPAQAAGLAVGDTVSVPGCAKPARIRAIAPHMQPASQSLLLRAELAQPAGCVKPFQFVQATVLPASAPMDGSWRVPSQALTRHQGQVWLFIDLGGVYRPVAVELREEAGDSAVVAAELAPQARLVVKGVATLKAAWLGLGLGGSEH